MKKPKPAPAKRRGIPAPMPKKSATSPQRVRATTTTSKKPMAAKPKNSGPTIVFGDGSTVGLKDIGKVKPTPRAVKPKPLPVISNKEYFKRQKEYVDSMKKQKKK
jgi:hypothetical protein